MFYVLFSTNNSGVPDARGEYRSSWRGGKRSCPLLLRYDPIGHCLAVPTISTKTHDNWRLCCL